MSENLREIAWAIIFDASNDLHHIAAPRKISVNKNSAEENQRGEKPMPGKTSAKESRCHKRPLPGKTSAKENQRLKTQFFKIAPFRVIEQEILFSFFIPPFGPRAKIFIGLSSSSSFEFCLLSFLDEYLPISFLYLKNKGEDIFLNDSEGLSL